jgi:hypothetical protein
VRATRSGRLIGMAVDQVVMAGFAAYHLGTKADNPEFHINGELGHADSAGMRESVEDEESGDDLIDNDG